MSKPIIGITMGDPAGVGPEVVAKALRSPFIHSICRPVVFGTARLLTDSSYGVSGRQEFKVVHSVRSASFGKNVIPVVESPCSAKVRAGKGSVSSGRAAIAYLDSAIEAVLRGDISAIVTAPVSKAAIRKAGTRDFTGHTEHLAKAAHASNVAMMFSSPRLKVTLVTTHLPLRKVIAAISPQKILNAIELSHAAMMRLGFREPHIGVAGINPHAGEGGAFGSEDARLVRPAVRTARQKGICADGPLPADTLFHKAYDGSYDVVVAMYHDQALAPFKMLAFDEGVNITLGLPFVRTSVDHGTAFDIAGKGIASAKSLVEAIKMAAILVR